MNENRVDLNELERLEREATAGEWRSFHRGNSYDRGGNVVGQSQVVGPERPYNAVSLWEDTNEARTATVMRDADARLIVALRNAFPAILSELRASRAALAETDRTARIVRVLDGWTEEARAGLVKAVVERWPETMLRVSVDALFRCSRCGCPADRHAVDDEERRECIDCECDQYELAKDGGGK